MRGQRHRQRQAQRRALVDRWSIGEGPANRQSLIERLRDSRRLGPGSGVPPDPDQGAEIVDGRHDEPSLDLRFIDLSGEFLDGVNLKGARLQGANLARASLRGADLRRANLRGAMLRGADLAGAHLDGVELREAVLEGANLEGTAIYTRVIDGQISADDGMLKLTREPTRTGSPWFDSGVSTVPGDLVGEGVVHDRARNADR